MIGVTNKQIAMRLGQMVLVLLGISFITFCLVMLAPGDPVRQMIAGNEDIVVSQVEIDALRHELGLDQPFLMQYLSWLGRMLHGNFGFSFMMKKPVLDAVLEALPATVILALASSVLCFCLPSHWEYIRQLSRIPGPITSSVVLLLRGYLYLIFGWVLCFCGFLL